MESSPNLHPCRLYLISPPNIGAPDAFAEKLHKAFSGGDVGAFQLRLKQEDKYSAASDSDIRKAAAVLMPVCAEHEVAFILNDNPALAHELGCDGVHLGQEDLEACSLQKARDIMGEAAAIGVSCHDSMHLAMEAGDGGADYIAFGAFHPTQSKAPEKLAEYGRPTAELVVQWAETTVVPSVCIGGITPENCTPIVEAGADFIAAITSVWSHDECPGLAVQEFNDAIKTALKRRKAMGMGKVA